ncbi:Cof-type HAD-IIB family hydrolase [Tumebacillus sp. ITR2]|uniref:Cof-type HAD-IIB family hydrolase n=1 Tax=Tumebacillus amylolyticus TaxID=2801339 RepID=A0ABS1J8B6_9BACL|nr:Cof-type HAD-IIB family hydrolase [Tumebacillus amylolyticus]MBL0386513.1 Cof-type HAD-IIB family hydrolase [Tumebacillus amylolyticus]
MVRESNLELNRDTRDSDIKIVFFDVDGTLMHQKKIPDSAKRAVDLLKAQGILPVLATGRSEFEIASVRVELGIDWAVTCNGAHVGYRGETIYGTPFPREIVVEWMERAAVRGHSFLLYGAEKMLISSSAECPYFQQADAEIGFLQPLTYSSLAEVPDIYQFIGFVDEEQQKLYTDGYEDEVFLHRWRTWAVDLNPRGVNKSVGISTLLDHFGFTPAQAAAFGDGLNDREMLQFVGRGIAMGNGHPDLLAIAPYRTKHAGEDGILYGVENLVLV